MCKGVTPAERQLLALIDIDEIVKLLQEMVQARSDTPRGDTRAVSEVVASKLREAGLQPRMKAKVEYKPNVLASLSGSTSKPNLLFHAHSTLSLLAMWQVGMLIPSRGRYAKAGFMVVEQAMIKVAPQLRSWRWSRLSVQDSHPTVSFQSLPSPMKRTGALEGTRSVARARRPGS